MRIVQISDVHLRNFKYHSEYEETFQELYSQLRDLEPDLVVNTGDSVHSKTQISPELVDMLGRHIICVSEIAPYRIILGNHDLNLKNTDRRDAISPVVGALHDRYDVELWSKSGLQVEYDRGGNELVNFWVFSIKDESGWPAQSDWALKSGINVGLFHGAIKGCSTDMDWVMDDVEHDTEMFSGLDYVMMGDIHKHQTWNGGRIAYAGSLIQQNFGETPGKGFLVWDIHSKDEFEMRHVPLETPLRFCTVRIGEDFRFAEMHEVPQGSYVKVVTDASFTTSEQKEIVELTRARYAAKEIFVVSSTREGTARVAGTDSSGNALDFSDPRVQERLLTEYLAGLEIDDDFAASVLNLDRSLQREVESDEEFARGVTWKLNKIGWTNLMQYGEDNIIDFDKVRGVYGIFGPNSGGKSSIFETITEGLFDRVTKDAPRNIDLINDERDEARIVVDFTVDGVDYVIERSIERIKYGQRKKDVKEWGKTTVDFYRIDGDGSRVLLNGDSRPETERVIRRLIGSFEDFCMTSMTPQISVSNLPGGGDFINCKDTDRKKLLYRFLGLDVFERKALIAKEAMKESAAKLKQLSDSDTFDSEHATEAVLLLESEIARISEERDRFVRERELIQERRNSLQVDRNTWTALLKIDVVSEEALEKAIAKAGERLRATESEIERAAEKRRELRESLADDPEPVDDPRDELDDLDRKITAVRTSQSILEVRMGTMTKKLQILNEVPCGDQFPDCRFLRDAFEAQGVLPTTMGESLDLRDAETELTRRKSDCISRLHTWKRYDEERRRLEALRAQIDRAELNLQALMVRSGNERHKVRELTESLRSVIENRELIEKIRCADEKIADTQRELVNLHAAISQREAAISKHEREMMTLETELRAHERREASLSGLRREADMYGVYMKAVGKNGIPSAILTEILPAISREINRVVASVSSFSVSLEADEDGQSLGLTMGYPNGRVRSVALGGGADKFIISLGIRAALSRITNIPKSNMFIVDEGFGKLDPENAQAIQRMFTCLRGMFDHIVIVSHTETLRDVVDGTIDIGVDGSGMAHVEHI